MRHPKLAIDPVPQSPGVEFFGLQVAHLRPGAHLCQIYATRAERLSSLVPFMLEGRKRSERRLYLADATRLADLADALEAAGVDTHAEIAAGGLCLLNWDDTYLRGGAFDPDAMLDFVCSAAKAARADAWSGLRAVGEMAWALDDPNVFERLVDYESRINAVIESVGARVICQYDEQRFAPRVIQGILRTHPLAVVGDHIHDSPYFEPLGDTPLGQLRSRAARATALAELGSLAAAGAPIVQLASAAVHVVARHIGAPYVEVLEQHSTGPLRRLAAVGLDEAATVDDDRAAAESWGLPRVPRRTLVVPDWSSETRLPPRADLAQRAVASSIGVSIGSGPERQSGAIWAHSPEPRIFSEDELAFMQTVAALLADAIARQRAEGALRTIVESASDVIARFDADLRVVYVNPAVERFMGVAAATLIGKTSYEAGLPELTAQVWDLVLRQAWRTGRDQTTELSVATPVGERSFHARFMPEFGADGAVQSVLIVARDVTDQRMAEAERAAAYREMASHQSQVAELLARVEHDHAQALQRTARAIRAEQLTPREQTILGLLVRGWTNREIAAELHLTPGTVKNHVQKILARLDVSDRTQAAVRAVELGLAEPA